MPPGMLAAAETSRAAYMRPLQNCPEDDITGRLVGEAFMPPGAFAAVARSAGGMNPSPTKQG